MVLIQMGLHTDDPPAWLEGFKNDGGFYYIEVRASACAPGLHRGVCSPKVVQVLGFSMLLSFTPADLYALSGEAAPRQPKRLL